MFFSEKVYRPKVVQLGTFLEKQGKKALFAVVKKKIEINATTPTNPIGKQRDTHKKLHTRVA